MQAWHNTSNGNSTDACTAATLACAVPEVTHIITKDGLVRYTFNMTTGATDVPSGATLSLRTSATSSVSNAVCNSVNLPGLQLNPEVGSPSIPVTNTSLLQPGIVWNCEFTVTVGADHKAAGKIAAFLAGLEWDHPTTAYYIDPQITSEVLVHTGTSMATGAVVVDTALPHINGMQFTAARTANAKAAHKIAIYHFSPE